MLENINIPVRLLVINKIGYALTKSTNITNKGNANTTFTHCIINKIRVPYLSPSLKLEKANLLIIIFSLTLLRSHLTNILYKLLSVTGILVYTSAFFWNIT